ncbi:MAG: chemotaxis protein CheA [Rhodospirillaceae bacterium]
MDDLIQEFVTESLENLLVLDQELVRFEQTPGDKEILSNIFRMMHTIKGTCGFLGLPRLEKIAHAGEDVLGKFREGALAPTPGAVTSILKCIDQIRALIESLSANGSEGAGEDGPLIAELKAIIEGEAEPLKPIQAALPAGPVQDPGGFPVAAEFLAELGIVSAPAAAAPTQEFPVAAELLAEVEEITNGRAPAKERVLTPVAKLAVKTDAAPKVETASADGREKTAPVQTIRVNVEVLENLMTLASEMVLTRNQLLQLMRTAGNTVFKEPIERLSRTTSELQEGVMKTRMQPIGNAWGKLPRIVRDLSNELGKKINLVMEGEETELDRQVLELIQDPLTHMVRNSADHGLERPEDRVAADKDEVGTIRLSAFHEGGHIIIEISDDGRGINTEKVRAKIVERGLATADEVAAMDDAVVNQHIMRAGFSTAEQVTKVSGRGVGMDVVRSNIEKIGGTVEFKSVFGAGSIFTIKIPLTLAIVSSLIVQAGEERFALPQIAVNEVVRISQRSEHQIEALRGAPILRLRNRLLPLVSLGDLLGVKDGKTSWRPGQNSFEGYVVVCRNGSQVMGVIVDSIAGVEEIVVKPLSKILGATKYFSGNTILGDGRVILILDLNGIASCLSQEKVRAEIAAEQPAESLTNTESILLFRTQGDGMKAVSLSQVQRIENFDMAAAETVQGERVIQYRDRLLPLYTLDGAAGVRRTGRQQVLVFGQDAMAVGLAIESIGDIVQDQLKIQRASELPGIVGSGIVGGKAVDVIDPVHLLKQGSSNQMSDYGAAA